MSGERATAKAEAVEIAKLVRARIKQAIAAGREKPHLGTLPGRIGNYYVHALGYTHGPYVTVTARLPDVTVPPGNGNNPEGERVQWILDRILETSYADLGRQYVPGRGQAHVDELVDYGADDE